MNLRSRNSKRRNTNIVADCLETTTEEEAHQSSSDEVHTYETRSQVEMSTNVKTVEMKRTGTKRTYNNQGNVINNSKKPKTSRNIRKLRPALLDAIELLEKQSTCLQSKRFAGWEKLNDCLQRLTQNAEEFTFESD